MHESSSHEFAEPQESPDFVADELTNGLFAVVNFFGKEFATTSVFDLVEALELTVTQIRILHHHDQAEGELTIKEVAELVGISLGAISRAVDGLVQRGFLMRRENSADRRMKKIQITSSGRGALRRFEAANVGAIRRFVAKLSDVEREELRASLRALVERPEIAACRPEDSG